MKKVIISGLGVLAVVAPSLAFAQNVDTTQLNTSISNVTTTINTYLVPLFLTIAALFFIYGVIRYVIAKSGEEKAGARNYIIWGIVGIAVILAIWGLANILLNFFGVGSGPLQSQQIPTVPPTATP
jgi:uncharacterized membrane protein YidH (DUF202 family)